MHSKCPLENHVLFTAAEKWNKTPLVFRGCFLEPADKLHKDSSGDMTSLSLVWAVFLAQCPLNLDTSSGDVTHPLFVQTSPISPLSLASGFWKKLLGEGGVRHALLF